MFPTHPSLNKKRHIIDESCKEVKDSVIFLRNILNEFKNEKYWVFSKYQKPPKLVKAIRHGNNDFKYDVCLTERQFCVFQCRTGVVQSLNNHLISPSIIITEASFIK